MSITHFGVQMFWVDTFRSGIWNFNASASSSATVITDCKKLKISGSRFNKKTTGPTVIMCVL